MAFISFKNDSLYLISDTKINSILFSDIFLVHFSSNFFLYFNNKSKFIFIRVFCSKYFFISSFLQVFMSIIKSE